MPLPAGKRQKDIRSFQQGCDRTEEVKDYRTSRVSEKILTEYNSLKENEALKRAELTGTENTTEKDRIELLEKEKFLETLQQEFRDIEKAIAETERLIAVSNTDSDNLKEYLVKLHSQKDEFGTKRSELSQKQEELKSIEIKLSADIDGLKEELKTKNDLIETLENELGEKENIVETKRREIFRISEELSNLRNETGRMQASLEALERKEAALIKESEDSRRTLNEIDSSINDVEGSLRNKNNDILMLNEKKGLYISELSSAREKIENLRNQLSGTKERYRLKHIPPGIPERTHPGCPNP